jgi:hypothetical protein
MANTQREQNAAIKDSITKFLQIHNIQSRVFVAGRPIDLWDLWRAVQKFDTSPGNLVRLCLLHVHCPKSYIYQVHDPLKFHRIGAQLGLPTDPQTGQIAPQQVKYLEEDHSRVRDALENTGNALACPPNSLPFNSIAPQPHQDALLQQILLGGIKFGTLTLDAIANLPYQPFDAGMYVSDRPWPVSDSQLADNPFNCPVGDLK